jgi:Mg2+ and Co2+ transporter CorA
MRAAVPTAIAGIYGMNFEHMPELMWKSGCFLVLGTTVLSAGRCLPDCAAQVG